MTNPHLEREDDVRRLLAAAAHPSPAMPADVTARLDDVLRGLAAERSGQAAEPVPLAHAPVRLDDRRHDRSVRRWPRLLVAAAAVSVLGLGIVNLDLGQGNDAMTSAESGPDDGAADEVAPESADGGSDAGTGAGEEEGRAQDGDVPLAADEDLLSVPRLATDSLTADVQRVADFLITPASPSTPETQEPTGCTPPVRDGSQVVRVRLDGRPAVLVLHPARDGEIRADAYTCDDLSSPAASTTVQAR